MKNKINYIIFILIILGSYFIGSVFYPRPFVNDNNLISPNVNFELKEFSFLNPKFTGYQFDNSYSRYNVYNIELNRNWFLGWNIDYTKLDPKIVLSSEIEKFKKSIKEDKIKPNESNLIFNDKYQILPTDTDEQIELKKAWHSPIRSNSIHQNIEKFKILKKGMVWNDYFNIIQQGDFGFTPDAFYPDYYRIVYNINSPKINFIFLTYKDAYPDVNELSQTFIKLEDIVLITQTQEMVKVPVNPDGTYNWEAVKDKVD